MTQLIAIVSLMTDVKDWSITKKNQEKKMQDLFQDLFHDGGNGAFVQVIFSSDRVDSHTNYC